MEASRENFRFYVYCESKRGKSPKKILEHLLDIFGDNAPCQAFVYKWCNVYTSGLRDSIQDLPHPGRPITQKTDEKISKVFDFVEEHPKSTLTTIANSLNLSRQTVQRA